MNSWGTHRWHLEVRISLQRGEIIVRGGGHADKKRRDTQVGEVEAREGRKTKKQEEEARVP